MGSLICILISARLTQSCQNHSLRKWCVEKNAVFSQILMVWNSGHTLHDQVMVKEKNQTRFVIFFEKRLFINSVRKISLIWTSRTLNRLEQSEEVIDHFCDSIVNFVKSSFVHKSSSCHNFIFSVDMCLKIDYF